MTKSEGKELRLDPNAKSTDLSLPAFLAKPEGAPVYHGFPLIEETRIDGWCYGAITEFSDPDGCTYGDGYVEAPDGSRAGLVWEVGVGDYSAVCPPSENRWGVYAVPFPHAVRNVGDLIECFRSILPELQRIYEDVHCCTTQSTVD